MNTILFVLLTVTSVSSSWKDTQSLFRPQDGGEYEDEWFTNIRDGDAILPGKASRKAVIFFSRRALDAYLKREDVGQGAIVIDVKQGTQATVKQEEVIETVVTKEEKRTGFTFTLE